MKTTKKLTAIMAVFFFAFAFAAVKPVKVQAESDGPWVFTISEGNATITKYVGSGGTVSIPETVSDGTNSYPVVSIGEKVFFNMSGITTITFPSNSQIKTIKISAFQGCDGLTSIEIPNSVETIDIGAFDYCSNLESFKIGSGLKNIYDGVFEFCDNLKSIIVDENNSNFLSENGVLYNKSKTKIIRCAPAKTDAEFVVIGSVIEIGAKAFQGCENLKNIKISDGVSTVSNGAFRGCYSLTNIDIPNSVISIGDYAFYACYDLQSITFDGTEDEWNNAKGSNDIGITVTPTFRNYEVTAETANQEWQKGSTAGLEFVFVRTTNNAATFDYFDKDATDAVQIDETPLEASNYKAESGSLKLTLNAAYLEGLSESDHSLQVNFKDGGTAYADFTIVGAGNNQPSNNQGGGDTAQTGTTTGTTEAKADNPKTGDSNAMGLFIALTVLSIGGVVVTAKQKKQLSK